MEIKNKFSYKWYLKDGYPQSLDNSVKKNDYKVFGTFINGGGSTMGYKLAGFNHLGGVEIDEKTAECYKLNHNPKYLFIEDIREFLKRDDYPDELYNLDILDGSPPCTTFSIAGKREKSFGVKKVFAEGNKEQTLDDLLFVYAELINKLNPKTFIMENVAGLTTKNSQPYLKKFLDILQNYNKQIFLLNGATMGLPQARERCFVIGYRKDFNLPKINLNFKEKPIAFSKISDNEDKKENITETTKRYWEEAKEGQPVGKFNAIKKLRSNIPAYTIAATSLHFHPKYKRTMNLKETLLASSFPLDYKFIGHSFGFYCGMCVPPLMIANIALQIKNQWLDKMK